MRTFASALLILAALAAHAHAGYRDPVPVTIRAIPNGSGGVYHEAWAALGDARGTSWSYQNLGCMLAANTLNTNVWVQCWASDDSRNYASCVTTLPQLIAVVASISDASWVYFQDDGAGNCVDIRVEQSSQYAPRPQ